MVFNHENLKERKYEIGSFDRVERGTDLIWLVVKSDVVSR
jgi:hypothetical protein